MALTEGVARKIIAGWPTGGFAMPCEEAVKCGDLLSISGTGTLIPANATTDEEPRLVAGGNGIAGQYIPCYVGAFIDGFTGGTEAAALYLSTTDGQYNESSATGTTDTVQIIGYVITQTMILATPAMRADLNYGA